jgi:hypothetical protein
MHGSIRQLNSTITTAPNIVLNPPVVENYHGEGVRFVGGSQNRNNQKQFHVLLAGEKKKTTRETFWSCFIPLGQLQLWLLTKTRLQYQKERWVRGGST